MSSYISGPDRKETAHHYTSEALFSKTVGEMQGRKVTQSDQPQKSLFNRIFEWFIPVPEESAPPLQPEPSTPKISTTRDLYNFLDEKPNILKRAEMFWRMPELGKVCKAANREGIPIQHFSVLKALDYFSGLIPLIPKFLILTQRLDLLLDKQMQGEKIEDNEKFTPAECRLIQLFFHNETVMDFLKELEGALPQESDDPIVLIFQEVAKARKKWQDLHAQIIAQVSPGDLIFYMGLPSAQKTGHASGVNMGHTSIVVNDTKTGQKVESHIWQKYIQHPIRPGFFGYAFVIRRNYREMLTPQGRLFLHYLEKEQGLNFEELIQQEANELHQEFAGNLKVENGLLTQLAALWGEHNRPASQRRTQMPETTQMCCSQFALYATEILDFRIQRRLLERMAEQIQRVKSEGKLPPPEFESIIEEAKDNPLVPLFTENANVYPTPYGLLSTVVQGKETHWSDPLANSPEAQLFRLPKKEYGLTREALVHEMNTRK